MPTSAREAGRLLSLGLGLVLRRPKRGKVPLSVEGQHSGAVLFARHVLLELGFTELFQLLPDGTKLGPAV